MLSLHEAQELHEAIGTVRQDFADSMAHSRFDESDDGDQEMLDRLDRSLELAAIIVSDAKGRMMTTCQHCERTIIPEDGGWIDPEATGDDSVWRECCDSHDTFIADHEPAVTDHDYLGRPMEEGGIYFLSYGDEDAPVGPYESERALCAALKFTDYPSRGYLASWHTLDDGTNIWGSIPSLNPDDLYGGDPS